MSYQINIFATPEIAKKRKIDLTDLLNKAFAQSGDLVMTVSEEKLGKPVEYHLYIFQEIRRGQPYASKGLYLIPPEERFGGSDVPFYKPIQAESELEMCPSGKLVRAYLGKNSVLVALRNDERMKVFLNWVNNLKVND